MSTDAGHVVTGRHDYTSPYLVAFTFHERRPLVDMLLREQGVSRSTFHVGERPVYEPADGSPTRWLTVGHDDGFGAALFFDDPHFPHYPDQPTPLADYDWAWVTLNPEPLADPPEIQYDPWRPTIFPRRSVLPPELLRIVILEWVDTGERPTSVEWLAVNELRWDLTDTGEIVAARRRNRRQTKRSVSRGKGSEAGSAD